jgi:hypothetical protein
MASSAERIVPGTRTPGWNDPPPLKIKSKISEAPATIQPITHPLFIPGLVNLGPNPEFGLPNGTVVNGASLNGAVPGSVAILDPNVQSNILKTLNTLHLGQNGCTTNGEHVDGDNQIITNGHAKEECSEITAKVQSNGNGKLSVEDSDLVKCLENLRVACYGVSSKPQMKKKLEEMARKFEILSESLRNDKVSKHTLEDLRGIVNAIHENDYNLALNLHTDLVASGNFSEIFTVLPAIKALIQYAIQLGVSV